jgi:vancomycin resistance protein VanK
VTAALRVQTITADQHRAFLAGRRSASFLQTPGWGAVKSEWRAESLGWTRDGDDEGGLAGVALVLHRPLPRVGRWSLAYVPEGPVIDWDSDDLAAWLDPMVRHLAKRGAFAVRMGPPVVTRRWAAAAVKRGLAEESVRLLDDLPPTSRSPAGAKVTSQLRELGWRPQRAEGGFAAGQPQYNFWVPLRDEDGEPRTESDLLASMNQLWRRNIRKADKAGVVATRVPPDRLPAELDGFHALYVHTAERDGFTPRPLSYFRTMFDALLADDPDRIALYTARHEDRLVAATVLVRVGAHAWYSYGASSTEGREVRGSNAVQWRMLADSLAAGADVYDLRGITATLDPDDPHAGLVQFKVGTGGEAVEYAGEWDLPVRRLLYRAFLLYMARR